MNTPVSAASTSYTALIPGRESIRVMSRSNPTVRGPTVRGPTVRGAKSLLTPSIVSAGSTRFPRGWSDRASDPTSDPTSNPGLRHPTGAPQDVQGGGDGGEADGGGEAVDDGLVELPLDDGGAPPARVASPEPDQQAESGQARDAQDGELGLGAAEGAGQVGGQPAQAQRDQGADHGARDQQRGGQQQYRAAPALAAGPAGARDAGQQAAPGGRDRLGFRGLDGLLVVTVLLGGEPPGRRRVLLVQFLVVERDIDLAGHAGQPGQLVPGPHPAAAARPETPPVGGVVLVPGRAGPAAGSGVR